MNTTTCTTRRDCGDTSCAQHGDHSRNVVTIPDAPTSRLMLQAVRIANSVGGNRVEQQRATVEAAHALAAEQGWTLGQTLDALYADVQAWR